ncbi:MAG: large conductance mechanosensitive channel protein MscL [Alphaproteobacteria bacterium]|nr:large conductance mechanosensitive channel protein MscL [Alphaproteobacteria bacterium]
MLKEFRDFAMRGNVVDLAVGVIIGAAFGSIVTSLVNDVIMPPIGYLIGGIDFSKIVIPIAPERTLADGTVKPAVAIAIGKFLNALVSFVIVAWVVFLLVKAMNSLKAKEEAAPAAPAPTPEDIVLLREIRDALKK